jgi:hypothetical protein
MKNLLKPLLGLMAAAFPFGQQNLIVQTSLSAAILKPDHFAVAAATGINAPSGNSPGSVLYVVDLGQTRGEAMKVVTLSGTTVTVRRDGLPGRCRARFHGSRGNLAQLFYSSDPVGICVTASIFAALGQHPERQPMALLCQTLTWTAGWGTRTAARRF